jgi:hypothetical protein
VVGNTLERFAINGPRHLNVEQRALITHAGQRTSSARRSSLIESETDTATSVTATVVILRRATVALLTLPPASDLAYRKSLSGRRMAASSVTEMMHEMPQAAVTSVWQRDPTQRADANVVE